MPLHFMQCIMLTLAHIQPFYALDQVHAEPELEVQAEQGQVEAITNLALDQGKPGALNQYSLSFILNLALYSIMIVH
jgi:hypothetical protein